MTTAAVPDAPLSNDEYRDWIIKVMGFLSTVLGVKLTYETMSVHKVGRYNRRTREVTSRIGAPLEDLVWLLDGVLEEFGCQGLFDAPDARRCRVLRLVPPVPQERHSVETTCAIPLLLPPARPTGSVPGRTPESRAHAPSGG